MGSYDDARGTVAAASDASVGTKLAAEQGVHHLQQESQADWRIMGRLVRPRILGKIFKSLSVSNALLL